MKHTLTVFFAIISVPVIAQLNNRAFEQRLNMTQADSGDFYLGINTLAFTKNNEYFNDIADGYTLFGYQINPYLSYYPLKNVRIDVGVYAQKDFGVAGYSEIAPTYTFKYKKDNLSLLFGTLEGSVSHRLIEPLYDFEKVMVDRLENGLQVLVENDYLFLDAWVDWQNMIFKGDNDQEEVSGGLSLEYILTDKTNINVSIPLQFVVFHRGGQIDSSPNPLQTYVNTAVGADVSWDTKNETGLIRRLGLAGYHVFYKDFSSEQLQAFTDGSGMYLNLSAETSFSLTGMLSYWQGHEFISIMGGQLYPSVSSTFKEPFAVEEKRELLIMRLFHELKLADNLVLTTRFEPFYDLNNENFEFSHGFYITYSTDFRLRKGTK